MARTGDEADGRRDPEAFLRLIREEAAEEDEPRARGRLKVFFGYAAGVGKTYAMLSEAHRAQEAGVDVVVGYVEPHTRADTLALLDGLEVLPPKTMEHRGIALREFDLDGALARRPQVVLVDELAHSNAPGSRHRKRYQDVEELLRAGIDVYTTVNVQHLEGLNDKVAAVTSVAVAERVPDRLFDAADSVEVVDLEPSELIERLRAGKVYAPERVGWALDHFFSRSNLGALREIALRRAADRLGRDRRAGGESAPAVGEDVLVLVADAPHIARVVRAAASLAEASGGALTALVVESDEAAAPVQGREAPQREALALAEQLGARVVTLAGDDPVPPMALYAASAGIRQIVVPASPLRPGLLGSRDVAHRLRRAAPEAQVTAVPALDAPSMLARTGTVAGLHPTGADAARAALAVALATALGEAAWLASPTTSVILMIYLLVSLLLATRADGFLYPLLSALGSVVAYNFFFTAPRFTFHAYGLSAPFIFAFLLVGTLAASSLAIRLKRQAAQAARRSYRTEVLLESTRLLQGASTLSECLATAAAQVVKILDRPVVVYEADPAAPGGLLPPRLFDGPGCAAPLDGETRLTAPGEAAVASWVAANGEPAGVGTDTLREAACRYLPIRTKEAVWGVAGVVLTADDDFGAFENNLLVALLDECGRAAEALTLSQRHRDLTVKAEKEELRTNLLRSISHDLRTPLTSISGDADMLLADEGALTAEQRRRLASDISEDAGWLISLVENLLSVTRLDDGAVQMSVAPELVADVIDEALRHGSRRAAEHRLTVAVEDELLMAEMDGRLMVQVLVNLVNNAIAYTLPGSCITVGAERVGDKVRLWVADDGPGIAPAEKARVFDLFYHGAAPAVPSGAAEAVPDGMARPAGEGGDARRGMGLGLALCRSILRAHGSDITLADADPHGCVFSFLLKAAEAPAAEEEVRHGDGR
ncbi:sensor histidine kinase KdpD [uncultured Adlercreutzia sp.]|uniref:sensor histidine kinase n=1 Tax=uncultured Adlercreutzia sp. TaxID=875803 RepID=UPI0026F3A84A|nr:sensor histidine kinase KdpD [uncultured Adlercreutzia sp.]